MDSDRTLPNSGIHLASWQKVLQLAICLHVDFY
jgi:hypothetical protein